MRYLFCTTKSVNGFTSRTMKQSADKVNDVAMLASAKVVPLITLCINFE